MPTKIEWTDETWNPVTGCSPVSAGCDNCYARRMATRLRGRYGYPQDDPFKVTLHPDRLDQPLHWRKPRMVFVPSMGDLFHRDVRDEFIDKVVAIMGLCKKHLFVILTKRPDRMAAYMTSCSRYGFINESAHQLVGDNGFALLPTQSHGMVPGGLPFSNLWLGVSVEDQKTADERIPILLRVPAARRVVSIEPMLGKVDLSEYLICGRETGGVQGWQPAPLLEWVICGGETGPGARPMNPEWVRKVRDQCVAAGVPFFLKQNGIWIPDRLTNEMPPKTYSFPDGMLMSRSTKKQAGRLLGGREWNQVPEGSRD